MNKLEILYKEKAAINRGNYFLLDKNTAIQFLMDCEKESIQILGIDGFYKIDEKAIQPSMENSVDYTSFSHKGVKNVYEHANQFIQTRDNNLYFEIVCG